MLGRFLAPALAAVAMTAAVSTPVPVRAQSAGAVLGGLAGGIIGGVIAGSMVAHAARQRPVVYGGRRHYARAASRGPRRAVARADRRPLMPAAGPQVVNASADPFAAPRGSATTAVSQTR